MPLDADADPFHPPAISTMVGCLHCQQTFESYLIEWRARTGSDGRTYGFWCCPIAGCDGKGFGFDIFPIDPDYRDEDGNKMWTSDDDESDDYPEDEPSSSGDGGSDRTEPGDGEALPW